MEFRDACAVKMVVHPAELAPRRLWVTAASA
jgi:hypothetical protein